ncbi:MAG TPA: asparagine synthase-related protein, partial [Steroidobacteraceae bacterium]|nr:asparagine synthase-related protein [Steroidobacteraceae bacterium]
KHLLRDVAAKLLPQDLMNAPKRGFVIPLKLWLRGRLQPLVRRLLDPRRLAEQGLVQPDFLERFAIPHFAQAADNTQRLWNMLMFQLWWDVFISRRSLDELRAEVRAAS